MNSNLLDTIRDAIAPMTNEMKLNICDIEYVKEGKDYFLRVILEDEDGFIDLDTCASASELISKKLDELDLIDNEYFLEVCSPGAEKPIKNKEEMTNAIGKHVYLELKNEVKGLKEFTGDLLNFENNIILLEYRDKAVTRKVELDYENIKKARLAVKF